MHTHSPHVAATLIRLHNEELRRQVGRSRNARRRGRKP
jgi:hypothetical protein